MRRRSRRSRGYSLSELMTVVSIIGVVTLVTLPAFMQLVPQYRIRNAASEMTATLRMLRQKAVATRTDWKMIVDPVNDRYALQRRNGASWMEIGSNGRPAPGGTRVWTRFNDVDIVGASNVEVVLTRFGTAEAAASIVIATSSTRVTFNRYTIDVASSGNVTTTPSKV